MTSQFEKELAGQPNECDTCGVKLPPHIPAVPREHLGVVHTFCSEACAAKFAKEPEDELLVEEEDDEV
jgi:YHS domain-containing protein